MGEKKIREVGRSIPRLLAPVFAIKLFYGDATSAVRIQTDWLSANWFLGLEGDVLFGEAR